jgi:hypothetical protein
MMAVGAGWSSRAGGPPYTGTVSFRRVGSGAVMRRGTGGGGDGIGGGGGWTRCRRYVVPSNGTGTRGG